MKRIKKNEKQQHKEEIDELRQHFKDRYKELLIAFADEHNLTDSELRSLGKVYENMFGKDGKIEGQYDYFAEMTTRVVDHAIEEFDRMKEAADAALDLYEELNKDISYPGAPYGEPGSEIKSYTSSSIRW